MDDPDAWDAYAVHYGTYATTRSHVFLNYSDYGEPDGPFQLPYYFWVLKSGNSTIVMDTGFSPEVARRRGRDTLINPVDAFQLLGVKDNASTQVVISHAHYDHIGNLDFFENARVIMARSEYEFWVSDPTEQFITHQLVEKPELEVLRDKYEAGQLRLIDHNEEIALGVFLAAAPGHTPGQLMLEARVSGGALLLAGDAVHVDEELERNMPFRHMCSLADAAKTYEMLRRRQSEHQSLRVIAGHEPSVILSYPPVGQMNEQIYCLNSKL